MIAPVHDEAHAIGEFVDRVLRVADALEAERRFELILVDDGSRDASLQIMAACAERDPRVRVLELSRNYGQTAALQAGLDAARGEVIITMDADLQHFPEEIPAFLRRLDEGFDMVCGWRHARREGLLRRLPSRAANALIRAVSGLTIHDVGTTFRAYRADLTARLRLFGESHRYVPVLGALCGARIAELPIENVERPHGRSKYGLGRTVGVFLDIILLWFLVRYLDRPMRAFGKLGLLVSSVGAAIIATLVALSFVHGVAMVRERSGWFLMAVMLILAGLQLILTGILAEILIRVHYAHSGQRTYVLRRELGAKVQRAGAPDERG
ncbi:MAG: glycosyltransferase family 2 protein [Planctomycetes bacterium]|nr:glycosyltransferase family 2 protein [Planctomycetota bacterium]